MRVLLVEDHRPLAQAVSDALSRAGFAVDHAKNAHLATLMAKEADHDLVILDLGLPDKDGLDLLPTLRKDGEVPVIVLTARDQLNDRLAGLDSGADDYIIKPVEMQELIARCRAVLRRPGGRAGTVLEACCLKLDLESRSATCQGKALTLGRREVSVLEHLMRAFGRVQTRERLEEAIYGFDDEVTPNALEAVISRLRKALAANGCQLSIVTLRGVGWMLTETQEDSC